MSEHNNKDKEKLEKYLAKAKEYQVLRKSMTDTQIEQSENKDKINILKSKIEIEESKLKRLQDNVTSLDTKEIDKYIKKIEKAKEKLNKKIRKYHFFSHTKPSKFDKVDIGSSILLGTIGSLFGLLIAVIITCAQINAWAATGLPMEPFVNILVPALIVSFTVGASIIPLGNFPNKIARKFLYTEKRIKSQQAKFEEKSKKLQKTLSSNYNALATKQSLSNEISQVTTTIDKIKKALLSYQEKDKNYMNIIYDIQTKMNDAYVNLIIMAVELKGQGLDVPSVLDEEPAIEESETIDIESTEIEEKPKVKKRGKLEPPKKPTFGIDSKNVTETLL